MSDTLFTVRGMAPFPWDLLAADGATGASKADDDAIAWLMGELDDDDPLAGEQTVALLIRNANGREPDEAAWAEAGWPIAQQYHM